MNALEAFSIASHIQHLDDPVEDRILSAARVGAYSISLHITEVPLSKVGELQKKGYSVREYACHGSVSDWYEVSWKEPELKSIEEVLHASL